MISPAMVTTKDFSPPGFVGSADPLPRVGDGVGMRDADGILGDAPVVDERGYLLSVLEARRAQAQPLGLEDGGTSFVEGVGWRPVQQGHGRVPWLQKP